MTFRVGQEVVCISLPRGEGYGHEVLPIVGEVYTIRGFDFDRPSNIHPVGLFLEEIVNKPDFYFGYNGPTENSFNARRFRPAVSRKTDISIFKKMLKPKREKLPA